MTSTNEPISTQLEATQRYAGMLFELTKDGMEMLGLSPDEVNFRLVNFAIMAGLDNESYKPIVTFGAQYRNGVEEVLKRVGGY